MAMLVITSWYYRNMMCFGIFQDDMKLEDISTEAHHGETLWTLAGGSSVAFRCNIGSHLKKPFLRGKLWENHGKTRIC
jgi:hypothetical protein